MATGMALLPLGLSSWQMLITLLAAVSSPTFSKAAACTEPKGFSTAVLVITARNNKQRASHRSVHLNEATAT